MIKQMMDEKEYYRSTIAIAFSKVKWGILIS